MLLRIFIIAVLSYQIFLPAAQRTTDIKSVFAEMLALHVDHKEFSSLLVTRSLKTFLLRFDKTGNYFLQHETAPFLDLSPHEIANIIDEYHQGRFSYYFQLNKNMIQAIHRVRKMRAMIKTELLKKKELVLHQVKNKDFTYCKTQDELYEGTFFRMESQLALAAKEKGEAALDCEERMKVLNFYEKKQREHENAYLSGEEGVALEILKACASSLDAHSMCFGEEEARQIRALLQNEICGLGICLKETLSGPLVTRVVPCSSADFCGSIQKGDILVEIEGEETNSLYYQAVLAKMEGPEHSKCHLTIQKPSGAFVKVSLSREKIVLEEDRIEVDYEPFADGSIGKIKLPSFYDNGDGVSLESDLREAMKDLRSLGPLYGLILDLRKNSGGFLHQAIKTASLFVHQGVVVIAKYAHDKIEYSRSPDPRFYYDGPIVLLTSKASASSAEILVQALKDEGLAVVVGDEQTYGKGSMQYQTVTDPNAKNFYKVTVGRYFTMSLKSTQIGGVEADIHVPTQFAPYMIGERYLHYPLPVEAIQGKIGIKEELKGLFQKYQYRPKTRFEKQIPLLRENSQKRLKNDKNFQLFLESIQERKDSSHGPQDLQMKEAVNILKDMIFLTGRPS